MFAASLPQDHEYQKTLRSYLAGLTEQDFAVEIKSFTVPIPADAEGEYLQRRITVKPAP